MNLRQINLRQMAVLLGATAGIAREAQRMLDRIERKQRTNAPLAVTLFLLAGVGITAVAIAARPELRQKLRASVRDWLVGKEVRVAERPSSEAGEASPVEADRPGPYVDGARP